MFTECSGETGKCTEKPRVIDHLGQGLAAQIIVILIDADNSQGLAAHEGVVGSIGRFQGELGALGIAFHSEEVWNKFEIACLIDSQTNLKFHRALGHGILVIR